MQGILLIASQGSINKTFTDMLSPAYRVYSAGSVEEGKKILNEEYGNISAILIGLNTARQENFAIADHMEKNTRFSRIPLIAITDELPGPQDMDCIDHGFFDIITASTPRQLVYKRIGNAIRAKDSLSLTELEKMLKALPACIFLKDDEGKYVFSTQYWKHLNTGNDPNWTIRGKTDMEIRKDKNNAAKAMEADKKILETGEGTDYIIEENTAGDREFLQLIKRPVFDEDGRISGIIALINDVTDHQLLKTELEKRAKTDTLTGLLNKSAAEELARIMVSGQKAETSHSALLIMDIDFFKNINDTYGHAEGDRVLAEIGRIIANSCRGEDVAGRIGGDEFMLLMRNINDPKNACSLASRLEKQVKTAFANDDLDGKISLSIGIALLPEHGCSFDDLFSAADHALYYVKNHGRADFKIFEPEDRS